MEVILREILGASVQAGHSKNAEQPGAILVLLFGVVRALDFVHDTLVGAGDFALLIAHKYMVWNALKSAMNSQILLQRCLLSPYLSFSILSCFVCTTSVRFLSISSVAHLEWFRIAMTISKQWEFCISFLRSAEVWYRRKWATERAGNAKFANILATLDWTAGTFLVSERENQCSFSMLFGLPPNGVMSLCERVLQRVFSLSKTRGCKFCQGVCWRLPSELHSEKWTWNVSKERQPSPDVHDLNLIIWRSKRSPHTWRCSLERLPQPLSHTAMVWISFFLEPAEASASTQDKSILVLQRSGKVTEVAHATPLCDYVCNLFGYVVTCRPLFYHVLSNIWYLYCHAPCQSILQLLCVQDTFAYQTIKLNTDIYWYIVRRGASGGRFRGNVAVSHRKKPLALWWQVVEKTLEDIAEKQPVAELSFQWSRWTALSPTQWSHVSDHWSQKASASARHCHCTFTKSIRFLPFKGQIGFDQLWCTIVCAYVNTSNVFQLIFCSGGQLLNVVLGVLWHSWRRLD